MNLTTAADLAAQFGISLDKFHELRRTKRWPHVRFGRFDYRFTAEHVEQIIAMQSVTPQRVTPADGRTERSAGSKRAS